MGNTTALSKAEQNALSVSYEVNGNEVVLDLDFVKRYLVSGDATHITDQEILFYMNTCKMQKLNPLASGECYLIKFGEKPAQLVVGKASYLKRAFKNPNYLYKKDGIVVKRGDEVFKKQGCAVYPGEELLAGWCEVFLKRNGSEVSEYKEVGFKEYDQGQANWKSKPASMLNKVAISQCLRDAFPEDYEGLYSEDEMIASGAIERMPDGTEVITPAKNEEQTITQEQRQALFRTARAAFGKEEANGVIKSVLKEFNLEDTSSMKTTVYGEVMSRVIDVCEAKRQSEAPAQPEQQPTE